MNSPAGEPQGPKRAPLPVRRGEGEATPRSLSALIQRQCTPALSPSDGERVPVRAGEGRSVASPGFHVSGCVRLGAAETTCLVRALVMMGVAEPSPFPGQCIMGAT